MEAADITHPGPMGWDCSHDRGRHGRPSPLSPAAIRTVESGPDDGHLLRRHLMKPIISADDLRHYNQTALAARFRDHTDREVLVEAATEALALTEHAVYWLQMFVNDGAGTDPSATPDGLDTVDRHQVLIATMAALDNAQQLVTIAVGRNFDRGSGWDPLTHTARG
jgi:hypothetical protein